MYYGIVKFYYLLKRSFSGIYFYQNWKITTSNERLQKIPQNHVPHLHNVNQHGSKEYKSQRCAGSGKLLLYLLSLLPATKAANSTNSDGRLIDYFKFLH